MEATIQECVEHIEQQLKSHWRIKDLANRYHYSPFHFSRLFKEVTGFTLAAYIRQRKLSHTLYEISQGQPKQQAALTYGFQSYSGFYRAFTQAYGCGPQKYLTIHSIDKPVCPNFLERGQIMYTKNELKTILELNWQIPVHSITPIATPHHHQLWEINETLILKKGRYEELVQHAQLCQSLMALGIDSQGIILTQHKEVVAQLTAGDFILVKKLKGRTITEIFSANGQSFAFKQGCALAKLHQALKTLNHDLVDDYDLIITLENWALPTTKKVCQQWQLDLPPNFFADLLHSARRLFPTLPAHVIHRDPNPSNILFWGDQVSGFIDFDLSVKSPRLFDLCYMATAILSHATEEKHYQHWPELLLALLTGYNSVSPLTPNETEAIYPSSVPFNVLVWPTLAMSVTGRT